LDNVLQARFGTNGGTDKRIVNFWKYPQGQPGGSCQRDDEQPGTKADETKTYRAAENGSDPQTDQRRFLVHDLGYDKELWTHACSAAQRFGAKLRGLQSAEYQTAEITGVLGT
jgi:hypothetical protein